MYAYNMPLVAFDLNMFGKFTQRHNITLQSICYQESINNCRARFDD